MVLVSSELDEIYALSDRIAIMYEGTFTGFRPPGVPVEELGLLMAGIGGIGTPEPGAEDSPERPAPGAAQSAGADSPARPDSPERTAPEVSRPGRAGLCQTADSPERARPGSPPIGVA